MFVQQKEEQQRLGSRLVPSNKSMYCLSKMTWPNFYSNFIFKTGQDFLDSTVHDGSFIRNLLDGSLFSVPILQDNGIKMASFLSFPEIVPLYNI